MAPDEGGSELEQILNAPPETGETVEQTPSYLDGKGQEELLTKTSPQTQPGAQGNLLAGKFKTPQDLEKGYQSAQSSLGKATSRVKQLEKLLQTPGVYERLSQSQEGRDTLAALGFEMREAQQREEQRQDDAGFDVDEQLVSDLRNVLGREPTERDLLRFETVQLRETNRLNWELFYFGQNRGKPLSNVEERSVREILRVAPRLTINQAYKLTPHFDEARKAAEDKALAEQGARRSTGKRPAPNAPNLPGAAKLDLQKKVTEMNDAERRAYITDIFDKTI